MQLGFKCSHSNTSILLYNIKIDLIIFLIYIDNILVVGTSSSLIRSIVSKLNVLFTLMYLEELKFLGLEVTKSVEEFISLNINKFCNYLKRLNLEISSQYLYLCLMV